MTSWPLASLSHIAALSTSVGIAEHARFDRPRWDLGYCTDDAGRALALACQLPDDPDARGVAEIAFAFLTRAHRAGGSFRLRCDRAGRWTDDPPSDDATGRALYGLGMAAARAPWTDIRTGAHELFTTAAAFGSRHRRARAYAALGAVEVLAVQPDHAGAAGLLAGASGVFSDCASDPRWPWPEFRLTYANALLCDAALAAAVATGRRADIDSVLWSLRWLVDSETSAGHFSFTPVGGRGPGDRKPAFDQQPIEASTMVDACLRAFGVTRDERWLRSAESAARWFLGDNDTGASMFDPDTCGGFDGLRRTGVNANQGAESTLALVATLARLRTLPDDNQAAADASSPARASSR